MRCATDAVLLLHIREQTESTKPDCSSESDKPRLVDHQGGHYSGKAIRVPLRTSFAALADPCGALQPPPAWTFYARQMWSRASWSKEYADVMREPRLTGRCIDTRLEHQGLALWAGRVFVEYAPSGELTQHLSSLGEAFALLLAAPPATSHETLNSSFTEEGAALLLTPPSTCTPLSLSLKSIEPWTTVHELQRWLNSTFIAAANCLTHFYSKSGSNSCVLEILAEAGFQKAYPMFQLHQTARWTSGYFLVSGGCLSAPRGAVP